MRPLPSISVPKVTKRAVQYEKNAAGSRMYTDGSGRAATSRALPPARRVTKKQRVLDFVAARGWDVIGETEWQELRSALSDISETTIRGSGIPIRAPWRGVAAHSIDELEASLCELSQVYETRADLRRYCRDQVIAAKDRARWAAQSPKVEESKRGVKTEMVEWMLVWLGDPSVFPAWVQLRRKNMG